MNEEYNKGLGLEDLADKLHLSKNYLCSLFKEETGFTFCQYLNTLKTNKARAIRFSTLSEICRVLDCQVGDILRYEGDEDEG
ncbi:helix-turn-helix domain-containing protein [Anaerococcus vaginalis]|uniref:helix-turn-helix domain-containing protein n=1 Tax=Anaerococcus vaginalis TaxID=33037 RepID=UPI0036F45B5F